MTYSSLFERFFSFVCASLSALSDSFCTSSFWSAFLLSKISVEGAFTNLATNVLVFLQCLRLLFWLLRILLGTDLQSQGPDHASCHRGRKIPSSRTRIFQALWFLSTAELSYQNIIYISVVPSTSSYLLPASTVQAIAATSESTALP